MKDHARTCPEVIVRCENECCKENIRREVPGHIVMSFVNCKLQCVLSQLLPKDFLTTIKEMIVLDASLNVIGDAWEMILQDS